MLQSIKKYLFIFFTLYECISRLFIKDQSINLTQKNYKQIQPEYNKNPNNLKYRKE